MGDRGEEDITSYILGGSTANMSEEAQDLESHLSGQPADGDGQPVAVQHAGVGSEEGETETEEGAGDGDQAGDESVDETPEQMAAKMFEEKLRRYDIAKSMVHLSSKKWNRQPKNEALCWTFFREANLTKNTTISMLESNDQKAAECFREVADPETAYTKVYCCVVCFETRNLPLWRCFKKGGDNGGNNLDKHLRTHDKIKDLFIPGKTKSTPNSRKRARRCLLELQGEELEESDEDAPQPKTSRQQPTTPHRNVNVSLSSISNVSDALAQEGRRSKSSAASKASGSSKYSKVPAMELFREKGDQQVLQDYHFLVAQFVTNNNISTRTVTRPTECPEFQEMMEYAMRNGPQLLRMVNRHMGRFSFLSNQRKMWNTLLAAISMYVEATRISYKNILKKRIPFIVVSHDIWDSKAKEVLGVSIFFYSPAWQRNFCIPIGLEVVEDKTSDGTAAKTIELLELVGVEPDDIFRGTNDTTNSALKTSRILAHGEEGTCAMHETQLAFDHAIGRKTRSKNNVIVDSFPECEAVRLKSLAAAGWLMDKKSKSRYLHYLKLMAQAARQCIKIRIPNKTRAAGTQLHYGDMIRSRWNLNLFWFSNKKAKNVPDDVFNQMAQFESILHPITTLIYAVQSDRPGSLAYTFIHVFRTYVLYVYSDSWWVADVDPTHNEEEAGQWGADAQFPPRNYKGEPLERKLIDGSLFQGGDQYISMVKHTRAQLTNDSRMLISRLISELSKYGANPTKDRLLALACNPFTATIGMLLIHASKSVLKNKGDEAAKRLALDHKRLAMDALEAQIRSICSELIANNQDNRGDASEAVEEQEEQDPVAAAMLASMQETMTEVELDPVKQQVERFFKQDLDMDVILRNQCKPPTAEKLAIIGTTKQKWASNWELISEVFDVMEWWESKGKEQYPLIYPVACCILSVPDSNGNQERTFSAATWMDDKLKKKQSDFTFQMKVLLYKNKKFLMQHRLDVKEEQLKAAETKTKKLLKISAKIKLDAAKAKATTAGGEEEVSEVDTESGDEDDMFDMMAAYYNDEDYMDMEK
jgi:hAT family C-terminal dimerisation region